MFKRKCWFELPLSMTWMQAPGQKLMTLWWEEWIVKGAQISKNTRDLACRNTLKLVIVWQETCQRQENATPVVFVARRENKVGMKDQQQFSLLVSFTSFKARPYSCEQNNTFWWISVSQLNFGKIEIQPSFCNGLH